MEPESELHFGLEPRWHQAFADVFRKNPNIERVILFGSRARGKFKPFSDIDLCLYGKNLDELDASRIREELEDLYHPWQVDVLAFESVSDPALKTAIEREGKVFFIASDSPASAG